MATASAVRDAPDAALAPALAGLEPGEQALVLRARALAADAYSDRRLGTGEAALDHAIGLAAIVAGLKLDAEARAAALLFAVPEYVPDAPARLAADFGERVGTLVDGLWKLNRLRVVTRGLAAQGASPAKGSQAEILRKMFLAMVEDVRVVLIRLASRTQTLRAVAKSADDVRLPLARETLDIYAPLANRLGIWQLKWELEDYAFRFLEPELYKRIAGMLEEKRGERETFIAAAGATLEREIAAAGVRAEVTGRPKHIYSIYNKMRGKGRDFAELYDVRGLRVLVDSVKDCYTALGVVHNLWQPIPREFDDYISRPKANHYRSLHTAVVGPDGRPLEVQIRTHEMHRHAELGVAAHWRYKEGQAAPRPADAARPGTFDERIAVLRQMLAWREDIVDGADWVAETKRAALDQTVYVLTPQGRVIELPAGATPVDFAYAVHTDLGHRCRGAKVDGAIVPLTAKLENGQRVEIIAAKAGGPSRDWLNAELGYLASPRARNKVRQWFNALEQAELATSGRAIVERELHREGVTGAKLESLAREFGYAKTDEFFAAVGREEIGGQALRVALRGAAPAPPPDEVIARKSRAAGAAEGVLIVGVDRLMTQLARCCKPVPPDPIVGFVTRGRGVSVHRASCKNLGELLARHPERAIETAWGERAAAAFPVDVTVQAHDRQGLLRDISEVFSREGINVTAVNTLSRQGTATMQFTVEVGDVGHLERALAQIGEVKGVTAARRR
ncbi:MAG: bifunctional (p)ppGpp synthetase/guanosine-3',5'-bis(diphosphate) 3'-pyrophosphohydrolase [Burkholderiales bacterium]|nr:bifunctional (p)ppGpp synthetase/guanosine-3',5'-bis(diphosphate) 3'-pyrophosphohydrolase [Burkholderiales bacterium]